MPLGPIGPIGPLSPRGPRGPGGPGGPIGPGRSLPITASHTRSCQRSLGRSQLPQQSCRSFMSFFPSFRFAGKLRQFSLCRRRLCGETLRGKIPSVVRHCRRLRAHECCPFIPGTGLLGVSQFVPADAQAECRRISTGVHINKAVRRCACGSNGGFVPEHRLSCAVIRIFEGCKRTAHSTARHLQCKRAGQCPLCLLALISRFPRASGNFTRLTAPRRLLARTF